MGTNPPTPADADDFDWDDKIEEHFAEHGICFAEVVDVLIDGDVWVPNRRFGDDRWLRPGYTRGGRALCIVVRYHATRRRIEPKTGWDAKPGERTKYFGR